MKNLFLFAILLLTYTVALSQPQQEYRTSNHDKEIIHLLRKQQSFGAPYEKPTGLKQRVIAQTYRVGNQHDSATFKYSGMRGSKFDFNAFQYDAVLQNVLEPDAFSLLADSISWYLQDTLRYLDYAYYRPDNKTDSLFSIFDFDFYGIDSTKSINIYDVNSLASHTYSSFYDPVTSDTNAIYQYHYDNTYTKKLIDTVWAKESGSWLLGSIKKYYYHANGQLDSVTTWSNFTGTLTIADYSSFTYYPDGKLKTRLFTIRYQNGGFNSYNDSFGYIPGIEYCTLSQTIRTSDFGTGPQISYSRFERHPGANGNPDSTRYLKKNSLNDSWALQTVYRYTYNSFDNPEEILVYNSSNTSGVPDQRSRFYYELYDDGLSVAELNKEGDFSLFPNPCTDEIFISNGKHAASQSYKVRIMNILGQEVLSSEWDTNGKSLFRLNTSNLNAGIYIVVLYDERGKVNAKQLIKK